MGEANDVGSKLSFPTWECALQHQVSPAHGGLSAVKAANEIRERLWPENAEVGRGRVEEAHPCFLTHQVVNFRNSSSARVHYIPIGTD